MLLNGYLEPLQSIEAYFKIWIWQSGHAYVYKWFHNINWQKKTSFVRTQTFKKVALVNRFSTEKWARTHAALKEVVFDAEILVRIFLLEKVLCTLVY